MSSGWAPGSLPYKLGTTVLGGQTGRSVKAAGAITIPPGAANEQTPKPVPPSTSPGICGLAPWLFSPPLRRPGPGGPQSVMKKESEGQGRKEADLQAKSTYNRVNPPTSRGKEPPPAREGEAASPAACGLPRRHMGQPR